MQRVQFRRYARFKTQRLYALRTVSIQILKTTKVITRDCESEREIEEGIILSSLLSRPRREELWIGKAQFWDERNKAEVAPSPLAGGCCCCCRSRHKLKERQF